MSVYGQHIPRKAVRFVGAVLKRRPSLATLLICLGTLFGIGQIFTLIWISDRTYLAAETERHQDETHKLVSVMANGMSDRLRNVEHMTRRVIRAVPKYLDGTTVNPNILDYALDDIGAYAQANEIGIGLFEKTATSDWSLTDYRGSPDYRSLFTKQTGSIKQLIYTADRSNHTEVSVAQTYVHLDSQNPETPSNRDDKQKLLFALTATPILRSFDTAHRNVATPERQIFFVSLAILYPTHPLQGPAQGCVFAECEAVLRAETGATWNFISSSSTHVAGEKITASSPIWPMPMDIEVTSQVLPLSSGIPALRNQVVKIAIASCALVIILFGATIYLLVRRPMATLVTGLEKVVAEPDTRLPGIGIAEFSDTFKGFNRMAETLQRVQADLVSSAEHWRQLIDENASILFLIDATTGYITFINKAATSFYGTKPGHMIGQSFNILAADDASHMTMRDKSYSKRVRHRTMAGERVVDISFGHTVIQDEKTILAIVTDATAEIVLRDEATKAERARVEGLESRISKLNEMVSRERSLTSSISHEIRNPVAIIAGAMDNIALGAGNDEKMKRRVENVKRAISRIDELLKRGLASHRNLSSGLSATATMDMKDITPILAKTIAEWKDGDTKHHYEIEISNDRHFVHMDKVLIQSVFDNVIHNAQKYSRSGTTIRISTTLRYEGRAQRRIAITVADQGIGIPTEFLPIIGEKMKRASNTGNIPGSGQGIHLCKEIMALHEGELVIESIEGTGTTVTIVLPLEHPSFRRATAVSATEENEQHAIH